LHIWLSEEMRRRSRMSRGGLIHAAAVAGERETTQ
jgi:hypothetical protein